jgi:uncharacterized protein
MLTLALLFGALIGLSLGLTGGGGAIFAVPLLVFALGVPPRQAVGVSLAAVGATALIGFLRKLRQGDVEIKTGLLFAMAGMLGAPIGSWLAARLPDPLLLTLFAALMLFVAARMWLAARPKHTTTTIPDHQDQPTCRRDACGVLLLNTRCSILLLAVGTLAGILAGMFGVGGGFIIVPALILFSGMSIHRAVATSLMVIALISASGFVAHTLRGQSIPPLIAALFTLGSIAGLLVGQHIAKAISGPALQKAFAVAILAVALFVLTKNFLA